MTHEDIERLSSLEIGHFFNQQNRAEQQSYRSIFDADRAWDVITQWHHYEPTPLTELFGLAQAVGLKQIWYKDEGGRFGLGSFKALGGAYAVYRLLCSHIEAQTGIQNVSPADLQSGKFRELTKNITVTSATDGNHGRSVAWGAKLFGCKSVIYIHAEVSEAREKALKDLDSKVIRVDGNYDESVRQCATDAAENGWSIVSDTAWEGYEDIPKDVMEGYTVMGKETLNQLAGKKPTHIFVQGGVGGLAAAVYDVFKTHWGDGMPRFVVVEPELADCLYESAREGKAVTVDVQEETVMAGLSCGEVSTVAWEVLREGSDDFITIPDSAIAPVMRLLAEAPFGDKPIVAGESAVAGLAGVIGTKNAADLAQALNLNEESSILVFGTEGATDPKIYREMTGISPESVIN